MIMSKVTRPTSRILSLSDFLVLTLIAALVIISTAVAFIESFDGLLQWAEAHGLEGWRAAIWPLQIDAFIAIGEGALFVAVVRQWDNRGRALAWTVTLIGAAVSVAANIGHVGAVSITDQATAAVPPLAACGGLTIGLQLLKRVIRDQYTYDLNSADHPTIMTAESLKDHAPKAAESPAELPPVREAEPDLPEPADAPRPDPGQREPVSPEPTAVAGQVTYAKRHPKWNQGVNLYRESLRGPGEPLKQRKLAELLGMKNRSLASEIINHVKNEMDNEQEHDVSAPSDSATVEEGPSQNGRSGTNGVPL
jgi:Protein of unknown function (DUF2637)